MTKRGTAQICGYEIDLVYDDSHNVFVGLMIEEPVHIRMSGKTIGELIEKYETYIGARSNRLFA